MVEIFASSVWTRELLATTVTDSAIAPRFSVMSTRAVAPAVSLMPSMLADRKPVSDASMR